jgi:hypothetical protein
MVFSFLSRKDSEIKKKIHMSRHAVLVAIRFYGIRIRYLLPVVIACFFVVYVYALVMRMLFLLNPISVKSFEENYWAVICAGGYVCMRLVPSLVRLFSPDSAAILFDKKSVKKENK